MVADRGRGVRLGVFPSTVCATLVEEGKDVAAWADAVVSDVCMARACLAGVVGGCGIRVAGKAVAWRAEVG